TLARFGLDGARHVLLENGLDATGMRSRAFLTLDGPPHGMLQSLAGKPLTPDDLRPVPAEVSMAFAARLQPEAMLDALRILRKPSPAPFVFGMFDGEGETDKAAREPDPIDEAHADLVAALGEVVTAWNAPGQGGFVFTGATLAVLVRDAAAAERAHARILAHLRTEFPPRTAKPSTATDPDQEEEYYARKSSLEQTTFGRHTIHYLNPRSYEPFALAWCL